MSKEDSSVKDVSIKWNKEIGLDQDSLVSLLQTFGDLLPNPLSGRVDLCAYAAKLLDKAEIAVAVVGEKTIGFLLLYANNMRTCRAHLPILSIQPSYQGKGLGKVLMARALACARQRGMREVELEVNRDNEQDQQLYLSLGFRFVQSSTEQYKMLYSLAELPSRAIKTPIEVHPRLLRELDLNIDLRIKRDDLYPMSGGGIKARKIKYIMRDLISGEYDLLVTNGSPQSNHVRASAVLSAQLGIRCHLVIVLEPGIRYPDIGNLLLMRLSSIVLRINLPNGWTVQ